MNLIWFSAACCVMLGSLICFLYLIFALEWVDALEMAYIFFFGVILGMLDTPFVRVVAVGTVAHAVSKYVAILHRVTGKGIAYIFLGAALWGSMSTNMDGLFLMILAGLFALYVVLVGVASLVIAIIKSRNLDIVRFNLAKQDVTQLYNMHAKVAPQEGLTQEEFKRFTPYASGNRSIDFEPSDVKLIFNALSSHPRWEYLSLRDIQEWCGPGPMVFI